MYRFAQLYNFGQKKEKSVAWITIWQMHRDLGLANTTPAKLENVTIVGHFGFVFEENSVREIT